MLLFPESGPKKNFRVNGFTKTVTPHLRSIQRHMAYFAGGSGPRTDSASQYLRGYAPKGDDCHFINQRPDLTEGTQTHATIEAVTYPQSPPQQPVTPF